MLKNHSVALTNHYKFNTDCYNPLTNNPNCYANEN